jgi:fumarate reductase subunit C
MLALAVYGLTVVPVAWFGLALLLVVMAFAFYNDFNRLISG